MGNESTEEAAYLPVIFYNRREKGEFKEKGKFMINGKQMKDSLIRKLSTVGQKSCRTFLLILTGDI